MLPYIRWSTLRKSDDRIQFPASPVSEHDEEHMPIAWCCSHSFIQVLSQLSGLLPRYNFHRAGDEKCWGFVRKMKLPHCLWSGWSSHKGSKRNVSPHAFLSRHKNSDLCKYGDTTHQPVGCAPIIASLVGNLRRTNNLWRTWLRYLPQSCQQSVFSLISAFIYSSHLLLTHP